MSEQKPLVLLTGATGYVGGRLLSLLEKRGCHIRCMVRRPQYLASRVATGTEVVAGDAQDYDSLVAA
ncbi:MAG: NAD(P)H-binding protein, partial [Planctomycetota bacterium]|nr:NAD(P)H-binding protein [Planctomycetota bacterium]